MQVGSVKGNSTGATGPLSSPPGQRAEAMPEPNGRRRAGWQEIPTPQLPAWDRILFNSPASVFQYPLYNEPFRLLWFSPKYLVYRRNEDPLAYAAVLTLGIPGMRVGLVRRGPVVLDPGETDLREVVSALRGWAEKHGYVFLRFTHTDATALEEIAAVGRTKRVDAFPLFPEEPEELLVTLQDEESAMLASFHYNGRRKIKKALPVGYEIKLDCPEEMLPEVWHIFSGMTARKGLNSRPLQFYAQLLRLAKAQGLGHLHVAFLCGKPVQAILIVRDRDIAYYVAGALDVRSIQDQESPSALLHWGAMRDCLRRGSKIYHLGHRSGPVYAFKSIFRPTEVPALPAETMVVNPAMYAVWSFVLAHLSPARLHRIRGLVQRSPSRV